MRRISTFLGSLLLVAACKEEQPAPRHERPPAAPAPSAAPTGVEIDSAKLSMYEPLPDEMKSKENPSSDEKVALGRMLFYDARLSKNQDVSCNTCHELDKFGVDGKPVSVGHRGQKGDRNSPTVYNAALQFVQFWDGRAETVEAQAKAPVLNPVEMSMGAEADVVAVLKSIPAYVEAFKKAFPDVDDPVTMDDTAKAIGAFERKLVTPSRWDEFLKGKKTAITDDEKKGFLKFVEVGCPTCHVGPLVGGTMYQKLGKEKPWPGDGKDTGRARVTKSASDAMMFKVPQLRNVAETGPYFHDGSGKTLDEAVKMMGTYQLGKELSPEDVSSIVTWLKSLTGTIPAEYVKKPALPESTAKTPKPNPK